MDPLKRVPGSGVLSSHPSVGGNWVRVDFTQTEKTVSAQTPDGKRNSIPNEPWTAATMHSRVRGAPAQGSQDSTPSPVPKVCFFPRCPLVLPGLTPVSLSLLLPAPPAEPTTGLPSPSAPLPRVKAEGPMGPLCLMPSDGGGQGLLEVGRPQPEESPQWGTLQGWSREDDQMTPAAARIPVLNPWSHWPTGPRHWAG